MNPARTAEGGRNWEGFGADPYLQGEAAYQTITGMQASGVQATAKHFIGNEEEHLRIVSLSSFPLQTPRGPPFSSVFLQAPPGALADLYHVSLFFEPQESSSNIDDRTLHEIYLHPVSSKVDAARKNEMSTDFLDA